MAKRLKKSDSNIIDTRNVFRKTLPFFIIFALSFFYSSGQFISEYGKKVKAANEGITVNIVNVEAPLNKDKNWKWQVEINNPKNNTENVNFNTILNWCTKSTGIKQENSVLECNSNLNPNELIHSYVIRTTTLSLENNDSFNIEHQAITCGRINMIINLNDLPVGKINYDTGINCNPQKKYSNLLNTFDFQQQMTQTQNTAGIGKIIRDFYNMAKKQKFDENVDNNYDENNPGNPNGNPGNAPGQRTMSPGDIEAVNNLMDQIMQHCGGQISAANAETCVGQFDDTVNDAAKSQLIASATSQTYLQCVGKVKADKAAQNPDDPLLDTGRAGGRDYLYQPPDTYNASFINTSSNSHENNPIEVGDIAIIDWAGFGHIMTIIQVNINDQGEINSIMVNEANMGIPGSVRNAIYDWAEIQNNVKSGNWTNFGWIDN